MKANVYIGIAESGKKTVFRSNLPPTTESYSGFVQFVGPFLTVAGAMIYSVVTLKDPIEEPIEEIPAKHLKGI